MFTLNEVSTVLGPPFGVERLGGNVYGVTDFSVTVTFNGGAFTVDTVAGGADVLICDSWTGAELFAGTVHAASEVPALIAAVTA